MTVKQMIETLSKMDQNALIVSSEYDGGSDSIHEVKIVEKFEKNQKIKPWDNSSLTKTIDENGICQKNIVFIN